MASPRSNSFQSMYWLVFCPFQLLGWWHPHHGVEELGVSWCSLPTEPAYGDILQFMDCRWLGNKRGALSRLTGAKLLSRLPLGAWMLMLVYCILEHLLAVGTLLHGSHKCLISRTSRRWNGLRTTTWFTTTALIQGGSPRAFLQNAQ